MIIFLAFYFFIAYIRHSNSPIYVSMYVDVIPNRNSNPTWLVRKSQRVNGKVVKQTLSNITKPPSRDPRDSPGNLPRKLLHGGSHRGL